MARIVIELGDDQKGSLDRMAEELGRSKADIIRSSLTAFRTAMSAARRGNRLAIVGPDSGVVSEIIGPWNEVEPVPA